ncbi:MAG: hypothetical protein HYU60_02285 [Magnetospirillum sp.]|nr:hypothetical protein [Magnetospirillum sp.]
MPTPTFPAAQPGRTLKWDATGTDLVNSAYDPDLVAITTADLAKGAAGSAKQAADAAYDATLKAGSVAAFADQAQGAADAAALSAQSASASRDQASVSATQAESAKLVAEAARDAAVIAKDLAVAADASAEAARTAAVSAKDQAVAAATASETARDGSVGAKTAAEAARDEAVGAKSESETIRDQLLATTGSLGVITLAEANLALSVLLQQKATGSSVARLVNAVSDRLMDQTGIGSLGGATWSSGYVSNLGGQALIACDVGSAIGDMTAAGGNAAAFNGATSQPANECAQKAGSSAYVGKDFGSAPKVITGAKVYNPNDGDGAGSGYGGSLSISLYASNSAPSSPTNGTLLGTIGAFVDAEVGSSITNLSISNATAYQYVWVALSGGGTLSVAEVELYGTTAPVSIATVSTAVTAASAPATVTLVAIHKDLSGTAILNTDCVCKVSRDDGTTWTVVTMADLDAGPVSGSRVLKGSADLSGQPSGTSLKWRVETANGKEQQFHGIWMQWK